MSNLVKLEEMKEMAACLSQSGLFGIKNPNQMLALMIISQAEGRHPAIAARDYHIINNIASLRADVILARFQESGGKIEWHALTHELADATFSHPSGSTVRLSWTISDAERAGLTKKDSGWQKYPRAMLRSRLVSETVRTTFPKVLCGLYTPEEVESFTANERDITPTEPVKEVPKIEKQKATEETLFKLAEIIELLSVSEDTIKKWLESEGVETIDLISEEFANKIISAANEKMKLKALEIRNQLESEDAKTND